MVVLLFLHDVSCPWGVANGSVLSKGLPLLYAIPMLKRILNYIISIDIHHTGSEEALQKMGGQFFFV